MKRSARHLGSGLVLIALGAVTSGCGADSSSQGGGPATTGSSSAAGGGGPTGSASGSGGAGMAGMAGETNGSGGSGGASDAGAIGESDSSAPGNDGAAEARADGGGDASGPAVDAAGSNKILIYGVTTGYRHTSIPAAANAITKAAAVVGLMAEQVGCTDATNQADPTKFTASALAQYGAVILLANSGEPLGYPATQEIQNLVDYVQRGGALVAIEDASHCYDGTFNGHPASQPFIQLIGGDFIGHPGDVSPATCTTMGTHRSVAQLPMTFTTTDEIYQFSQFRMDNQVVLRCVSTGDSTRTVRPVSWLREEGAGRYFFTALGHLDASWTRPMDLMAPNSRLVEDHLMPGLLWAMRR